jgi:hypothetical protein
MRHSMLIAMTCLLLAGSGRSARAVFFDDGAHYIKHGYHVNERWPWPYTCPDRIAVREPFSIMVNNGWRRENLIGVHHFNPTTNELTPAGQLRVQWIMTQAPAERRDIFVERDLSPESNTQRLAAVRDYAAKVAIDGHVPQVQETHLISEGRPAAVVDAVNVNFMKSMPPPVLPDPTTGGSSSSGN